jgi:hypothetical protein
MQSRRRPHNKHFLKLTSHRRIPQTRPPITLLTFPSKFHHSTPPPEKRATLPRFHMTTNRPQPLATPKPGPTRPSRASQLHRGYPAPHPALPMEKGLIATLAIRNSPNPCRINTNSISNRDTTLSSAWAPSCSVKFLIATLAIRISPNPCRINTNSIPNRNTTPTSSSGETSPSRAPRVPAQVTGHRSRVDALIGSPVIRIRPKLPRINHLNFSNRLKSLPPRTGPRPFSSPCLYPCSSVFIRGLTRVLIQEALAHTAARQATAPSAPESADA